MITGVSVNIRSSALTRLMGWPTVYIFHSLLSRKDKNSLFLELVNQILLTFYPFPAIIWNHHATAWVQMNGGKSIKSDWQVQNIFSFYLFWIVRIYVNYARGQKLLTNKLKNIFFNRLCRQESIQKASGQDPRIKLKRKLHIDPEQPIQKFSSMLNCDRHGFWVDSVLAFVIVL